MVSVSDKASNHDDNDTGSVVQSTDQMKKLAEEAGVVYLDKAPDTIDKRVLHALSEDAARRYKMVAFERNGNTLSVAMVHPQDIEALNVLRFLAEKEKIEIQTYLITEAVFKEMMNQYTGTERALKEAILSLKGEGDIPVTLSGGPVQQAKKSDVSRELLQDTPIAKLVQVVVKHAVDGQASDIHIEPIENSYRVRFRVDGILHSSLLLPVEVGRAVISRIKILSSLKIDEKRKPQDGRFRFEEGGQEIDLRVSTFPVVEGEKVVMRLLDKSKGLTKLETLGLMGRNYNVLLKKIKEPYGIILMTGPTGSGKSTSLYAFLNILNQEERNIVTLEDPVEYFLEGINQSQIKPEIGYTFANGLRSILRQDPNVIMVGEIRDSETAELAIHAALTGHLVFSTLHTNDALGSIPRLVDMGIEPFLLASSLQAVAAQRLVRRICEHCKKDFPVSEAILLKIKEALQSVSPEQAKQYGIDLNQKFTFFAGKGCKECGQSGYKGRIAVHEVFDVNSHVQEIILEKNGIDETLIRKESIRQGMTNMKQDGLLKAMKGLTTLAEVERVTEGAIMVDEE